MLLHPEGVSRIRSFIVRRIPMEWYMWIRESGCLPTENYRFSASSFTFICMRGPLYEMGMFEDQVVVRKRISKIYVSIVYPPTHPGCNAIGYRGYSML